jgi:peroxiredoxin family protein
MANRKIAILASGGSRDTAYKVLNIATAAASMEMDVIIFFTFAGINLIHKGAYGVLPLPADMAGVEEAFKVHNVPTVPDLVAIAQELGVKLIGCQMTMDLMNLSKDDLVDGVEVGGAATFLASAQDADVTLTF